ncbi:MAG: hypothetical protein JNK07_12570 [Alphaproteobacteria bacterium]|nr:hypothetical protein [Alphaproteobacteria bacterium]
MSNWFLGENLNALPYLLIVVVCLFWLLIRTSSQREAPTTHKQHAWRVGEVPGSLRRIWHVTRDKGESD